jgi:hypothetical protein
VLDSFTGSQSSEDCRFFIFVIFGDEDRDWLADYFVGSVAENALRAFVPTRDDAIKRLTDNRVVSGFD